jgi:methylenetetrahydrofolate dehydrogenase (NADP+)/methenyltetrahydrofolate cyclohydrolase
MKIIDGKAVADKIRAGLRQQIARIKDSGGRIPCLAVVLVGEDPASRVYVGHKEKACQDVGIISRAFRLPLLSTEIEVLELISRLNADSEVDGILVQLPLPAHLNRERIVHKVVSSKDVDGLVPENQGRLSWNISGLRPCTPLGIVELIRSTGIEIKGKHAVVIGRSVLVGLPVAQLLLHENATVTIVHSNTPNPKDFCRNADILVAAAGKPHLVDESWVKPGAVVIDVGIHRVEGKLTGDVNFSRVAEVAGFLTPVPGGVGPMTIAMLLANCVSAYNARIK